MAACWGGQQPTDGCQLTVLFGASASIAREFQNQNSFCRADLSFQVRDSVNREG